MKYKKKSPALGGITKMRKGGYLREVWAKGVELCRGLLPGVAALDHCIGPRRPRSPFRLGRCRAASRVPVPAKIATDSSHHGSVGMKKSRYSLPRALSRQICRS